MQPTDPWSESQQGDQYGEEPDEQPYYESPQAQAMDQLLSQAEGSVTPAILAALIAAYAMAQGAKTAFSGINEGISFGAEVYADAVEGMMKTMLFILKRDNAARLDMLKRELLPFAVRAVISLLQSDERISNVNLITSGLDIQREAEQAIDETLEHVFNTMTASAEKTREYVDNKDFKDDSEIFDILNEVFSGDAPEKDLYPFTKRGRRRDVGTDDNADDTAKRHMHNAARRFARLLVRDVAFRVQERVAKQFGFTHKRWVTCADDRVRLLHRARHGSTVRLSQRFQGPGGGIRWPGDPAASLDETANCRCSLEWLKR